MVHFSVCLPSIADDGLDQVDELNDREVKQDDFIVESVGEVQVHEDEQQLLKHH